MDETETTRPWLDDPPTVGAVLVAHNGARWLPKVLASFGHMDHAPTAWQVVDVDSSDGSADLLTESFGADLVTHAPSGTGFGDAVRQAVARLPRTDWIWLLHDDAAVLPDTLAGLLDVATSAPDIAMVGPKIREWPSLRRLLEVGVTITSTGGRETGLETGEPDAGQHDRPRDVLAVNTAGMLVRRDVWDELDGLDPDLPLYFDDVDFGWRLARAGHRAMTAPGAVIFHAEASRRGTRPRVNGDVPHWERRRAALFTLLANTSLPRFVWQLVRLFISSLVRVTGLLIGKDPEAAGDELLALRSTYLHPVRLLRARRRRARTARRSQRAIRALFPVYWLPYQHGFDVIRETVRAMVKPEAAPSAGRRANRPDLAPDEDEHLDDEPPLLMRRPWLTVVLGLVLASLIAGRGLLGGGLAGGALLPAPASAGQWWGLLFESHHDIGLGSTSLPPLFALPLAVVATPVWFSPGLVITVLLVFSVPLAALSAHRFGRLISPHRAPRIVWAAAYGLTVAATGAVAQGRLGAVIALIIVPIIANSAWQLVARPGWQPALRLGIWIALAAAFAPIVLLLGLVALLILWWLGGRRVGRQLAVAIVVPVLLLGPWVAQRALRPWRMWWEAGLPLPGSATVRDVVLGRAGGPGEAPLWLTATLIVLAVAALVPRATRPGVQLAWLVALLGLAVALLGTLVTYSTPGSPADVTPWVGVPAALWLAGLSTAVLLAVPAVTSWQRPAIIAAVVVALVMPVGTGVWWVARGMSDPVDDSRRDVVPAFLADRPGDTLVLTGSVASGVEYEVVRGEGPFLGQEALAPPSSVSSELTSSVRRLLAQSTGPQVETLAGAGIGAIYAPHADADLARRIDATPLLEPSGSDDPRSRVWTLVPQPDLVQPSAPWWHRVVMGVQVVLWLAAIVLTAPVRRRTDPEPLSNEEDEVVTV
ncbi:glycosyltransferase [Aeromicrobium wangtongii]|uniref:glycosyltransferase n=1 Tax=Aeromicrobium wangtongii TaxID=2969247 RepID=UPI002016E2B4|nr:glycosyltransferase family 2 protein [Aeromicrobium wangtongii]MCL3817984.1 glycosyltransferase family 2 protein [Aeromicrobium wangtongii]